MYKLSLQLRIEGFLSHGKPYLASHPELGVPLGIFNTYDEPDYASRIKSIKKLGKKGNSLSLKLAKEFGVENPVPSFQYVEFEDENGDIVKIKKSEFSRVLKKEGYTRGATGNDEIERSYEVNKTLTKAQSVLLELSRQRSQADLTLNDTMGMIQSLVGLAAGDPLDKTQASMEAYLDILALTDNMRKEIITGMGMDQAFMDDMIVGISDASKGLAGFALTTNDLAKVLFKLSSETGRAFMIPEEALVNATKLQELYNIDMANIISEFDKIVVGVSDVSSKNYLFSSDERIDIVNKALFKDLSLNRKKISVVSFGYLTTDLCKKYKSNIILRGLRAVSDFEYEFQLAGMNRKLNNNIETIFLMSDVENQIISSRFVKEIAQYKGDLKKFTTKSTIKSLMNKYV